MTKRKIMRDVLSGKKPPYVPWRFDFTQEPWAMLCEHYGSEELAEAAIGNHSVNVNRFVGQFTDIGNDRFRDIFGVVWDRSIDKDIGNVEGAVLPEPTLEGYTFPDPLDPRIIGNIDRNIEKAGDRFRVFDIGFSLFERAWTLRGMENLMSDFIEEPEFVHQLLTAIANYNIAQAGEAVKHDIDAIHYGDDWGQQHGLIMGKQHWDTYIKPQLARMYAVTRNAGKFQSIHSCGDVDELFDDLIELGVNCFNPFQPEVMNTEALLKHYRGRLAFHGGLSTQRTLPYGTVADVRAESRRLLELGREGAYVFAPSHAVEGDVPLENILAFIEEAQAQPGAGTCCDG